jgi:hypothetical protein
MYLCGFVALQAAAVFYAGHGCAGAGVCRTGQVGEIGYQTQKLVWGYRELVQAAAAVCAGNGCAGAGVCGASQAVEIGSLSTLQIDACTLHV